MNTPETVCLGMNDGIRCTKLISNDAVFCLDCDSGNNDSLPAPLSLCVLKNESREERNISESKDDETLNDKWFLNEEVDTNRAVDVSTTSSVTNRCINCEQNINTNQLFCDKCGFKLGSVCVGEVNGNPCSKFISVETNFCANCGTANTGNSSAQCKPQFVVESKKEPFMKLVAVTYSREQAKEALTSTEEHEEKAAYCPHTDDDTCNIKRSKSKEQTPRDESKMELTSLEVTKTRAIDAAMFADSNEGELGNSFLNLSVDEASMEGKKDLIIKGLEEIKDSDEEKMGEISNTDVSSEEIKDSDEDIFGEISNTDLSSEETVEEIRSKGSILNDIQKLLETEGVIATRKYLTEQVTKWKRAKVKFAVAGQSAAGKSAFINAIRGVIFSDEGYAEEGFGDTTMNIGEYVHPQNKQIIYCDLPGYGTTTITREKFLEKVKISDYDMFIIFFSTVPTTDDEWLVRQLQEAKIPLCFVRTKLDQDIESGKRRGKSEKTVLNNIVETIARATKSIPALKDEQKFIISSYKPSKGDMSKLAQFMQEKVRKIKCEAILFFIPAFTVDIIKNKYLKLRKRIPMVSLTHTFFSMDYKNIVGEIKMFFRVFELDTADAKDVPGLKHHFSEEYVVKLVQLIRIKSTGDLVLTGLILPLFLERYIVCMRFLTNLLDELKTDARTMYTFLTKNV